MEARSETIRKCSGKARRGRAREGEAIMTAGGQSDEAIARQIRERLTWEPEIEGAAIAVRVVNGTATLEGSVRGYQGAAAERIVRETPGVTAVENRLRLIDPLLPGDETIAELVNAALTADPVIPAARLDVAVHDGIVELRGQVRSGAERVAAEDAVLDLPGVVDVRNRIVVAGPPAPAEQLESTIRDAFVAEAVEAASRIVARVDGDQVTLAGSVPTPHHRHLAERTAWSVSGVAEVRNEIRVEP